VLLQESVSKLFTAAHAVSVSVSFREPCCPAHSVSMYCYQLLLEQIK